MSCRCNFLAIRLDLSPDHTKNAPTTASPACHHRAQKWVAVEPRVASHGSDPE